MELVQQPVFLLLLTCSAGFSIFLSVAPYFGFGDDIKLVKDSTLAVTLLAGLFGAVMCASSSVAREIRTGTALAVLSKPVGKARFILGKYAGLAAALGVLTYVNLVACLLASRMAYDAYGSADVTSFGIFCAAILLAFMIGGFLNYFLQIPFVATAVLAVVVLTTLAFGGILLMDPETTGASADPRTVDWRLAPAVLLLLFAVWILTALALACSTRLELLPTLAICSAILFLGLVSDYALSAKAEAGSWWASGLYTVIPNWQLFWLADALEEGKSIPLSYIGKALGYVAGYVGATLMVALLLFEDRELT